MKIELDAETVGILDRVFPGLDQRGTEQLIQLILRKFAEQAEKRQRSS